MFAPARVRDWRLADAPARPGCVPPDSEVAVRTTPEGIRYVRTPEDRFAGLPGYDFAPHYAEVAGLRMHFVDEGPSAGEVVLLVHGEPAWSYMYRKMIRPLAAAGHRVIAVDHLGMGRSDKPVDLGFHTFENHVAHLKAFLAATGLHDITLVCQDWGSLIGLRVAGDQPELFARIVVANGTLPLIPQGMNPFLVPNPVEIDCAAGDLPPPSDARWRDSFQRWIVYALTAPDFRPSRVVQAMAVQPLSPEELAAYDAPFPSFTYKAAVRAFPSMLAAIETQNEPAWNVLGEYRHPFLCLAGERDLHLGLPDDQARLTGHVPGAAGQPHERFAAAGLFIQEDVGQELAAKVAAFMAANPLPRRAPGSMRGGRYGEVLVVGGGHGETEVRVYTTVGLSDCPQDLWDALDAEAIRRACGARLVILNGPRHFLMDEIAGLEMSEEVVTFGGLRMRRVATLPLPVGGRRENAPERPVRRMVTYIYHRGREIYEIVAPDGAAYVMQSYALTVDPTLTEASLRTLGERLRLPAGWTYRARRLEQDLVLRAAGQAHLFQDELQNAYQMIR